VVRLMVEIIEPFGGKVFDPACGSGGMFVQSAKFIDRHRYEPYEELVAVLLGSGIRGHDVMTVAGRIVRLVDDHHGRPDPHR